MLYGQKVLVPDSMIRNEDFFIRNDWCTSLSIYLQLAGYHGAKHYPLHHMPEPLCRASQLFYRLQFLPEYALSFYQSRYHISFNTNFSMRGIDSVKIRSVHKSLQSIQITVKIQMDSKHIDLFVYRSWILLYNFAKLYAIFHLWEVKIYCIIICGFG